VKTSKDAKVLEVFAVRTFGSGLMPLCIEYPNRCLACFVVQSSKPGGLKAMSGVAEELQGAGKIIHDGLEIGEVAYSIRVVSAGPRKWLYPFARFHQRGYLQFYDLLNKPITLVLEDGRCWDCRLSSLDGTVVATGDWPAQGIG
jgi:hypothetical protein